MKNIRLFWQIYPAILVTTIVSLIALFTFIDHTGRTFYLDELKNGIKARALLIESTIAELAAKDRQQLQDHVREIGRRAGTRITVVDNQGVVLADSNEDPLQMENHANRPELKQALAGMDGSSVRFSNTLGQNMLYVAIPVMFTNHKRAALRLSVATTSYEEKISSIKTRTLIIGILTIFLAALLAFFSARRISQPLEKMKQGAEQLTKGRIDQLIKIESDHMSVEMAGLAGALNQMAGEINRRVRVIIQQRNELEAVFSSMADSVVAIDADQKILRMNKAASSLFSLPANAVKGEPVQGVIRNQELLALIEIALKENVSKVEEIILFDGTNPLILQTHVVPLCDDKQPMGVLLIMHDLTKLNRLENLRQDFVANVSHELKTPITAIKGYVETLLDGAVDDREDAIRFLSIISKQTNRLDSIIDDLLALSRIENKENVGSVELVTGSIFSVLSAAIQTCDVYAREKGIQVEVECDDSLQGPMNPPLLEQAVINLLQNAIAYSPDNSTVSVKASPGVTLHNDPVVNIAVIDKGPGIAKEHLPRLFERFYRCDKARSRDVGGTGLGLAIVKHIAHAHNGRIDVISSPGKGSTFTLTIPATA